MSSGVIGAFPEDTGAQNSSEVPNEHSKSDNLMSGQNQDEAVETDTAVSGAQYGATGNAAEALKEDIESINAGKVNIRFKPLPSAPILKTQVFKINASQKFEAVVRFLKKKLDCKPTDSVFCYVNSVFAPALDENVGGLWRCFKTDDQLIVCYSLTPAFG